MEKDGETLGKEKRYHKRCSRVDGRGYDMDVLSRAHVPLRKRL